MEPVAAPPSFGGHAPSTGTASGQTLYGLPVPDEADELTMLGDDSGPLSGETTRETSGPPSIGTAESSGQFDPASLFDNDRYGELDLSMPSDDGLELDLPGLSTPDRAGVIGSRRELPPLVDDDDLPMPSSPDAITKAEPRRPEPARPAVAPAARPTTATPAARPTADIPAAARPTTKVPAASSPGLVRPAATIPSAVPPAPARPPAAARPPSAPPVPRPASGPMPSSVPPPVPPAPPRRPPPFTASSSNDDLPVPSRASGNEGFGLDLPTPSRASDGGGFGSTPFDLPTPARQSGPNPGFARVSGPPPSPPAYGGPGGPPPANETPAAARGRAQARSSGFDDSMISVADLDLPSPVELDLPGPTGVDLPGLAQVDLLTPAGVDLLQPASLDVEPANILPAPAALDVEPARSDMQPAPGDMRPARGGNVPVPRAIATNAAPVAGAAPSTAYDPLGARRSPTPRDVGGEANHRPLILALIGIGLLAAVGGGLYAIGVFDPPMEDVPPQSVGPKNAPKEAAAPATLATERSTDVLAAMAKHTPKAYVDAIALAEAAGDRVGQAEAALRLHMRYGPDAVRRGQAETWLEPYVAQPDPFVQRVVGLAALARNDLAKAEAALVGDDASTRLYRGWLRLQQGRALDAAVEADAVLVAAPGDVAGLALRHEAKAEIDAASELPGIEASLAKHAGHPGLTLIAAKSAIASGQLHKGRTWLDGLGTPEGTGQGYAARVLSIRGALDEAAGAPGKAALRYAEALAFAPEDTTLGPSRVRALMKAKRTAEASGDAAAIVKARPGDVEALLLRAEVEIEGGGGDDALAMLDAIEKATPGLARTSYLRGLVHGMRNEIEPGKKAFATALERDPKLDIARIAEARMLDAFGTSDEALKVLEAARKIVSARPGGTPKVEAEILRVRAEILRKTGQTAAALAALDQALTVLPNDNDTQLARGLLRLELGQYAEGKADLLAVYERTGNYAGLTAPLGRIFVREGNLTELEKLVGNVLEQPEATNEELIVGARLRLAQGKPEEAKVLMERLLAASANDWEAHLLMAESLVETGAYAEALVEIDASLPPTPSAEKHLWRGKILEFNARHGEAPAEYRAALALDPELHEARFLNGRLLASKAEWKAAEEELLKVVAATDAFPRAYVELARAQIGSGDWEKARANLKVALEKDENLYGAHFLMGFILAVRDNNDSAAIASLEKATVEAAQSDQDFPGALLRLGELHATRDKKAAEAAFERLMDVAPKSEQAKTAAKKLKGL